jgi:hypothetical protein
VGKILKRVVKSPVFKRLAIVGGIVAGSMFLGPAAAGLIKKGAATIAQRRADKKAAAQAAVMEAPRVTQQMVDLLSNPQVIEGIRSGRIPPPPTDIGSPAFVDWATAIGMAIVPSAVQSQWSAYDRSQIEAEMRSQVMATQSAAVRQAQYTPPEGNYSPMPEVPGEIQESMQASMMGGKNMPLILGVAVLGLVILGQKNR